MFVWSTEREHAGWTAQLRTWHKIYGSCVALWHHCCTVCVSAFALVNTSYHLDIARPTQTNTHMCIYTHISWQLNKQQLLFPQTSQECGGDLYCYENMPLGWHCQYSWIKYIASSRFAFWVQITSNLKKNWSLSLFCPIYCCRYKYVEVGAFLKDPSLPIWMICSESHFTVLFGLDTKCMSRNTFPFDLIFYDELAAQEVPVRLTVRLDPNGGWTGKVSPLG